MINEPMSEEDFKRHCEQLDMSDVEIAVAAAFHGDFELVDCRDLAEYWNQLSTVANQRIESLKWNRDVLIEVGDWMMHLGLIETYDYVPSYTNEMCVRQAQDWAKVILSRLYDMGEDEEDALG